MPNQMMGQLPRPTYASTGQPSLGWGDLFSKRLWMGTPDTFMQTTPYTSGQQRLFNQAGQMGLQGLLSGQMPGGMSFEPMKQQATTNFMQNTIPSLAERFTSMGEGAQRSSAFQGALGQAGAGLNENLAAMQMQNQMQMMPILMQLLGMGTQPQYEQQYVPGQMGIIPNAIGSFAGPVFQAGGQAAAMLPQLLKLAAMFA